MKIDVPIDSSSDATKNNDDDDDSPQNDIKNELIKQGQFFRDLFSEQLSEHEIEFGHVCENPDEWEQRFERQDMKANNYRGKVKWGNKNGEYGEHYWDLNY
ncbi:PREDICTED: uncharacterized protein LOC107069374 [Polistes dominula]|uniref:Uncharacterized protein LOC107069374 n=1 Tax=Polistes dominula TaxID=743375 RepID=A0ABM1IPJ7_POLDO|nr:PREDICTED: uncharacterized protein LOC107069374 [Polistes dominula]